MNKLSSFIDTNSSIMNIETLQDNAFLFQNKRLLSIEEKIKANSVKLSDLGDVSYKFGVTTGINAAFILTEEERNEVIKDGLSDRFVYRCARGRNISKYSLDTKEYIICIEKGYTNSNRGNTEPYEYISSVAPNIMKHLEKIDSEYNGKVRKRKCGDYWWEHNYTINKDTKVMLSKISINMSAVIVDDTDVVPLDSVLTISGILSFPLCCMLNSSIVDTIYKVYTNCSFVDNGGTEKYPSYLNKLYIPYREDVNRKLGEQFKADAIEKIIVDAYGLTEEDIKYLSKFRRGK